MSWALANQEKFNGTVAANQTEYQVMDSICNAFIENFGNHGFNKDECLAAMNSDEFYNKARISWKFGCYSKVNGTPTVFINGAHIEELTINCNYDLKVYYQKLFYSI